MLPTLTPFKIIKLRKFNIQFLETPIKTVAKMSSVVSYPYLHCLLILITKLNKQQSMTV